MLGCALSPSGNAALPPSLSDDRAADLLAAMLDNIEDVEGYVAGLERDAFEQDELVRDAVERCLERVCEAVARLGEQVPPLLTEQRRDNVGGLGDRLRHARQRISADVVWGVLSQDLPGLKLAAALALARLQGATDDG